MKANDPLFSAVRIGKLDLPNRVAMAPMTRRYAPDGIVDPDDPQSAESKVSRSYAPGGIVGPATLEYYKRRAAADVGLIITEPNVINHLVASHRPELPRLYGEEASAGWKAIVDGIHCAGGRVLGQIWHVGMSRPVEDLGWNSGTLPIGPSGLALPAEGAAIAERSGVSMTTAEIDAVIDAFAAAAQDAERIGFDGIEIHAAHGYLIDQFFWATTNHRDDAYGGGFANRARFAAEIIKECKNRTSANFTIGIRISQWKITNYRARMADDPVQFEMFLEPLARAGVDIIHCSTRRFWEPAFSGSDLTLSAWAKKITGCATIAVGSVGINRAIEESEERAGGVSLNPTSISNVRDGLERGDFDLIAVGRALLADPLWASKVKAGAMDEVVPYTTAAREKLY